MSSLPFSKPVDRSRRSRGVAIVRRALDARGAVAFVHASGGTSPDLRYLAGREATDECAIVVDAERVVVCLASADPLSDGDRGGPAAGDPTAERDDGARDVITRIDVGEDPARAAAEVLADEATTGTVLAPPSVPHDCALHLENAGFDLASSTAVTGARRAKTDAERRTLRHLGTAARAGLDRARTLLARAAVDDELRLTVPEAVLAAGGDGVGRPDRDDAGSGSVDERDGSDGFDGEDGERDENDGFDGENGSTRPLTSDLLRREVAVTLARHGAEAGGTRVLTGSEGAADPLRAGRPIVLDCRPHSPDGLRCRGTWTVVVDGDGGWQRRAHVAVDAALRAARRRAAVGETAGGVETEVRAELTAYGFDDAAAVVHGVGLAAREGPTGNEELTRGTALVVGGRVDGDDGPVALCETVLVGDDVTPLVGHPNRLSV